MSENTSDKYHQLSAGFEFPPQSYALDAETVELYLKVTRESNPIFKKESLVPPMEVAAMAMSALGSVMVIPPGAIHVSQELDFLKAVKAGETITCYSKVSSKQEQGGLHLMSIDISVLNEDLEKVLSGKVGFALHEPATINDHSEYDVNPD